MDKKIYRAEYFKRKTEPYTKEEIDEFLTTAWDMDTWMDIVTDFTPEQKEQVGSESLRRKGKCLFYTEPEDDNSGGKNK